MSARFRKKLPGAETFAREILRGNTACLSRALTLMESRLPAHRQLMNELIRCLLPRSGQSLRIAVTGVPGAGKSTFIDRLGMDFIRRGHRVGVLAVDPSSALNGGSILGDKTRMEQLGRHPRAFIRPVPGGNAPGGVARHTRESIILMEAAGYDRILVETIGSGQSELTAWYMTDLMILLKIPGAGDELQGIKRGIMEMADLILINKADGPLRQAALDAVYRFQNALRITGRSGQSVPVMAVSAALNQGIDRITELLEKMYTQRRQNGLFEQKRKEQNLYWFDRQIQDLFDQTRQLRPALQETYEQLRQRIIRQEITPHEAAEHYWEAFVRNLRT